MSHDEPSLWHHVARGTTATSPAMQLDGRELEMASNVGVLDLEAVVHRASLEPLGRHAAGRDGRPTPERLELGFGDRAVLVHLVGAGGGKFVVVRYEQKSAIQMARRRNRERQTPSKEPKSKPQRQQKLYYCCTAGRL